MNETTIIDFQISYAEEAVTITARVCSSPNQAKIHRISTLEEALKRHNIRHDNRDGEIRIYLNGEEDVEKVLESIRFFEKQDKIKETKLNLNKKIASDLENKLKSIFPPPEAVISVKHEAVVSA